MLRRMQVETDDLGRLGLKNPDRSRAGGPQAGAVAARACASVFSSYRPLAGKSPGSSETRWLAVLVSDGGPTRTA